MKWYNQFSQPSLFSTSSSLSLFSAVELESVSAAITRLMSSIHENIFNEQAINKFDRKSTKFQCEKHNMDYTSSILFCLIPLANMFAEKNTAGRVDCRLIFKMAERVVH